MPLLNHFALMCEVSKTKSTKKKQTFNSVPVVEDGDNRDGVVL